MDLAVVEYVTRTLTMVARMIIAASLLYWLLSIVTSPDFSKDDVVVVSILSGVISACCHVIVHRISQEMTQQSRIGENIIKRILLGTYNNMKNITKNTKTILFASLIAAMILPFGGMDFADAKKQQSETDEQLTQWASTAAQLQIAITNGDDSEYTQNRLAIVLDNLNDNGITIEGQGLEVLADYYSDGIEEDRSERCSPFDHSMKVRAAYEYIKFNFFGYNFYGHQKGPWSADIDVVGETGLSQVQVKSSHTHTEIRAYSIAASDDRPTTVVYHVEFEMFDDDNISLFPSGIIEYTDLSATFGFAWDRHNSPKTPSFTPLDTNLITVVATLDTIS